MKSHDRFFTLFPRTYPVSAAAGRELLLGGSPGGGGGGGGGRGHRLLGRQPGRGVGSHVVGDVARHVDPGAGGRVGRVHLRDIDRFIQGYGVTYQSLIFIY